MAELIVHFQSMQASVISILIIMETGSSRTRANTRATSVVGSGLGTFFSSYMPDKTTIGLAIGYVYLESPAEKSRIETGGCNCCCEWYDFE